MPTIPYIHFDGQCAEALAAYAAIFNGTGLQTMRYADGPGAPEAWASSDRIMHGQVTIGDGTFMASDYPPGVTGSPPAGFSVMQSAATADEAHRVFALLAEGGAIIDDIKPTFFSPAFGMVRDRFGTAWIISALQEAT
jgi:PhnB protein